MIEPFKPIHSEAWLNRYLSTNYYKKKYDRFMWWRSFTPRNKPLSKNHPLPERILNGDFDMGSFTFELELVEHRINAKHRSIGHDEVQLREAITLDKVRRKRLQEDRDKDERTKLEDLKRAFLFEFKMTKEQYDKEVIRSHKDLITFYFKMEDKYGKKAFVSTRKPKGLRLASERC